LEYYNRAAETGNPNALCGAAGMYLKGEGTEKNISRAVGMYHQAAKDGSIRALNGLGYIYFFGHGDEAPMNKVQNLITLFLLILCQTKAYHYFKTATEYGGDSDSWFNAGYCLEHGIGL
jgi:TPR repeat protein